MIETLLGKWRNMGLPGWCEHKYGWLCENDRPITLTDWQRAILGEYWQRREQISTLLISSVKKTGKTLLNSLITTYRWLTIEYPNVHFCIGNDKDQTAELQVSMIASMVKRHPVLSKVVKITKNELVFEPTGARIVPLAMDWQGSGGSNFSTVSFSELWAFTYEGGRRLYEELTPIPHLDPPCLRIVDSYAGYEQESELLADVWQRGESGERVNPDWPIYQVGGQLSYVHQGLDAQARCWRGDPAQMQAYYNEQRATLRENTFRRLHLNEWVSSESAFVIPEQWDALMVEGYHCPSPGRRLRLTVGLDLSTKNDYCAAVGVWRQGDDLMLGPYRIFRPPGKGAAIKLEAIEEYLVDLHRGYGIRRLRYDPFQAEYLAQRLRKRGIRAEEYPQTVSNLTRAGNALFDAVRLGQLTVYEGADDLRKHVLNASAKETERGIRLVKTKSARKIDAAIALAMAVEAEQGRPGRGGVGFWSGVPGDPYFRVGDSGKVEHAGDMVFGPEDRERARRRKQRQADHRPYQYFRAEPQTKWR